MEAFVSLPGGGGGGGVGGSVPYKWKNQRKFNSQVLVVFSFVLQQMSLTFPANLRAVLG
jgi:hypothetical protein